MMASAKAYMGAPEGRVNEISHGAGHSYFEAHGLKPDWPAFLDDFGLPTIIQRPEESTFGGFVPTHQRFPELRCHSNCVR